MPTNTLTHFYSLFLSFVQNWKMTFGTVHFILFLPLVAFGFFLLPQRFRRVWLLAASFYFYFFAAPKYVWLLVATTLIGYVFGSIAGNASTEKLKKVFCTTGVLLLILNLAFFKYNGFFEAFTMPLFKAIGIDYTENYFSAIHALGISFYSFTSIGYLLDISSNEIKPEKNLITYSLFISFFPHVSMGPIAKAANLLPQLKNLSQKFSDVNAPDALRTICIGFFKKLAVADSLLIFVKYIYGDNLASHSGLTLVFATFAYALQLYFDFSGYSDIALGVAKLLGIKIEQNFNTPYFSTNFSSFWARWHISLSAFLQNYIFMPLVWSRFTEKLPIIGKKVSKPPVLSAIAAVFIVSGIWHGSTVCFLIWGALQAVFRIGEELLHRFVGKPQKRPKLLLRFAKTAVVFILWSQSLIFFKIGSMKNGTIALALKVFTNQFKPSQTPLNVALYKAAHDGIYTQNIIIYAFLAFMFFCTIVAIFSDWLQFAKFKGKPLANTLVLAPASARVAIYFGIVLCCFAAFILQSGGFGGNNFLYAGY